MDGKEFTLDDAESLVEDIINGKKGGGDKHFNANTLMLLKGIFANPKTSDKTDGDKTGNERNGNETYGDETYGDETDGDETGGKQSDITDMPNLESEQRRNKKGQGLKILTPDQMLSRLPIAIAQLKAENNSGKLKNEIRQPLYSLYRLKNWLKQSINI